jgi:hypothetical protein
VAGGLAVSAAALTAAMVGRAQDLSERYGHHLSVPVAQRALGPGDTVEHPDVVWHDVPRAFVGGTPPTDVIGRTVVSPVLRGEVVVAERLAADGLRPPLALAPEGSRILAVPVGGARPDLALGDLVDVVTVALDGVTRTQRVAAGATVVGLSDEATTIAVATDEVAGTARAALEQTAVLALVGPREEGRD